MTREPKRRETSGDRWREHYSKLKERSGEPAPMDRLVRLRREMAEAPSGYTLTSFRKTSDGVLWIKHPWGAELPAEDVEQWLWEQMEMFHARAEQLEFFIYQMGLEPPQIATTVGAKATKARTVEEDPE